VPVPSQDKLGGCGIKIVGMAGSCCQLVRMEWQSIWIVGVSACVIVILLQKIQKMENRYDLWVSPRGCPTYLCKQEVGHPSRNAAQPCARVQGCVNDDLRADGLQKGWGFRVSTLDVDSLTGRTGEVVEALSDRKVDVACIQETRWKGSGCKSYGAKGKRYKLFWVGGEERLDGVRIFVAEKWVDSVVSVKRHSKRVLNLRMVLDNGLLNVLTVYPPHSGKPEEEKENFWNEMFHLASCMPQNDMVVLAGDMNGHVRSSNVGYDGMLGGFGYGDRNADGSRILCLQMG